MAGAAHGVLDVREVVHLPGGTAVALSITGYAYPPFLVPPLEEITPDVQWPDAEGPSTGR